MSKQKNRKQSETILFCCREILMFYLLWCSRLGTGMKFWPQDLRHRYTEFTEKKEVSSFHAAVAYIHRQPRIPWIGLHADILLC